MGKVTPIGSDAIRVTGLRKLYGDRAAVDGVDLAIATGETFALLGPNGAGKTTTTEILEGYRTRDGGEVSVLGEDPQQAGRAWRARIGIVLQSGGGDFDELRVDEVVTHFARYFPRPYPVDEVIELVGLGEKRRSKAATLSGGQRRRLDVALGILGHPELLFLDEPTTGFDPEARRQFWALIKALKAEGTTILLTTHYLDEAEHLADRVGVIEGGKVLAVNTPDQLGGRHEIATTVRWQGPDGELREQLTAQPTRFVVELSAALGGGEVPGLTVSRPSLEDIYLKMIGENNGQ